MKKLMVTIAAMSAILAYGADTAAKADYPAEQKAPAPAVESEQEDSARAVSFWGFGNYGIYSGYMLYGSIVNPQPTLQGYVEGNAQVNLDGTDLGYLGIGIWSNSDLTGRRSDNTGNVRRAFNEWDFNIHWGRTFWFTDDKTWGLDYRTSVVWYWYPHRHNAYRNNVATTMDWNHSFAIVNPYVTPYLNVVHEYHESNGTILQFGLKKDVKCCDKLTITPIIEGVWRNRNYGWCFSGWGKDYGFAGDQRIRNGLATGKLELDATYMFTDNIGVFAKIAYVQNISHSMRRACRNAPAHSYGCYNQAVWGGCGLTFNF